MRRLTGVTVALVAVVAAVWILRPYAHGLSFVVRAADMHGRARQLADLDAVGGHERDITIPTADGRLRGRLYEPTGRYRRIVLLVAGLHPSGIEEARLVKFARDLASSSVAVVTPEIPELTRFEVTPAITKAIEGAASWLASSSGLAPDQQIGLMGISFSGGLAIVAAGRPSLADRIAYVFSLGGHHDLPRVLRYLCTGSEPLPRRELRLEPGANPSNDTYVRAPHDYGAALVLQGIAERLVPKPQVDVLRDAVRRYLLASAIDTTDKTRGAQEFAAIRLLADTLPDPSKTLMRLLIDRDIVHLGPRLLPYIGFFGGDPALSPSKSPKPSAPVLLLHGRDDNLIPPIESEYLADDLRGHHSVRMLLSGLLSHAATDRPVRTTDIWELASFWGDLLQR